MLRTTGQRFAYKVNKPITCFDASYLFMTKLMRDIDTRIDGPHHAYIEGGENAGIKSTCIGIDTVVVLRVWEAGSPPFVEIDIISEKVISEHFVRKHVDAMMEIRD